MLEQRNLLVAMRDGVCLAVDLMLPPGGVPAPVLLNFGPYHKDGRGGRLSVHSVHRHFVGLGYACVSADLRGLGNSDGVSPGAFAPGEAQDGHDLVEWIGTQSWCDGNVGMWGVSYPGVTALSTAATNPPHLKAIVTIHASADLYRGVAGLGGTRSGFWMRADWGPRMAAYNLMPPLWHDAQGRWARVWAQHLEGNQPWIDAFCAHPGFDPFWQSRVVDLARIRCATFAIGGWRDLYADCTPLDFAAISAPKKLLMGPWKHEFPDTGKEAPAAGLWDMQRWFERWLRAVPNGIDCEPPVSLYVQGRAGAWRAQAQWTPLPQQTLELWLTSDGGLADHSAQASSDYRYDPTVGMCSLAWDPWTTALDPALTRDQAGDDARSLCFTGAPLAAPMDLIGAPQLLLEVCASALPLNLVAKLCAVAANGASTLISTGWADLSAHAVPGQRVQIELPLRATAYRLEPGERLRVAISCADFPRVWPTPNAASLSVFHGLSRISLPLCLASDAGAASPLLGPLQAAVLGSENDLGGGQTWDISRNLMDDSVRLDASRSERVRVDAQTELVIDHAYHAGVAPQHPELAHMGSTTSVRIVGASGATELVSRTVSTAHGTQVDVDIRVDGQPYWHREWKLGGPAS